MKRAALLRWVTPVVVAGLLVGGTLTVHAVVSSAGSADLPPRTAAQLLVDVRQAKLTGLSGTVVQTADLGVPSLPDIGGAAGSDLTSLITGTHTLRVWYDGLDKFRFALLGKLGESDVIRNGSELWVWSSQDNTATHRVLPAAPSGAAGSRSDHDLPWPAATASSTDPEHAAEAALAAIGPSTLVTTDSSADVAGRSTYQLILQPRSAGSLISSIRLAIDGVTHIPLRVQVFAVGKSTPAFEVAFSSVDFSTPDQAEFAFDPPPGATVTQGGSDATAAPGVARPGRAEPTRPAPADPASQLVPKVVGSDWTSVVVAPSTALPQTGQLGGLLAALPTVSGSWGRGHLLAGTVFSLLITDDGRLAVGAVRPDLLYRSLGSR